MIRLPTGSVIPTLSPTIRVAQLMMNGIVNSVMILLSAVRITDRATSPPARRENTFDELPPGQHAISISPIKNTGVRLNAQAKPSAIIGSKTSCPNSATAIGQGCLKTLPKSSNLRVRPRSNISSVRMGSTIQIVFMFTLFFGAQRYKILILHSNPD